MVTSNEESVMNLFDVTVSGPDVMYHESFRVIATSKLHAMKKAMGMARKCDNVSGELRATAKVVR
jgi:hypothetical protein